MKHDKVDRSLSQALQQARLGKKMTQKQLATSINEKPQVKTGSRDPCFRADE